MREGSSTPPSHFLPPQEEMIGWEVNFLDLRKFGAWFSLLHPRGSRPEPSLGGSAPIHPVDSSLVHIWIPCRLSPRPLAYELLGSNDRLLLLFLFLGLCGCQALRRTVCLLGCTFCFQMEGATSPW